jgi:CHAD domain-containing protein
VAYRFERGEPLPDGVRRIVREQLRGALDGLEDPSRLGIEETVHDVRKRGKKVRGLARLVRGAIGREGFQAVNAPVRDAGAELSPMRDAHAILATFERLVAVDPSQLAHGEAGAVRSELQRRSLAASPDEAEGAERIRRAAALLETALSASQRWRLRDERVLERGVRRIYARGQAALRMSQSSGEIETRHEWRKREKDLWYAIRLLAPTAPSVLSAWEMRLDELADALGDDHDLAVLTDMLTSQPDAFGGASSVDPVLALADRVAVDLQDRAYRLGATLYSEPPRTFGRRMGRYWQIWHTLGDEHAVGGLDEIQ